MGATYNYQTRKMTRDFKFVEQGNVCRLSSLPARVGSEWCRKDTITEEHDEDLEEEFHRFLDEEEGVPRMWHSDEQMEWGKDIAHHFANWQKQQMMKDAVDAIVHKGLYSKYIKEQDSDALSKALEGYNPCDKVKIIIIREEGK